MLLLLEYCKVLNCLYLYGKCMSAIIQPVYCQYHIAQLYIECALLAYSWFLPRDAMLAQYMLKSSVRLSQEFYQNS